MKRLVLIPLLLMLNMWGSLASAQTACDTTRAVNGGEADIVTVLMRSLRAATQGPTNCNAFNAVVSQLVKNKPRAGSQLKAAGGADAGAAAGEIASLRSDPAQAAALEAIQKEPDPLMRSMLEASQFHAAGLYSARDLRLDEARRLAGVK